MSYLQNLVPHGTPPHTFSLPNSFHTSWPQYPQGASGSGKQNNLSLFLSNIFLAELLAIVYLEGRETRKKTIPSEEVSPKFSFLSKTLHKVPHSFSRGKVLTHFPPLRPRSHILMADSQSIQITMRGEGMFTN